MRTAFDWSGSSSQRREQGDCLPPQPNNAPKLEKYRPEYVKKAGKGRGKRRRSSWAEAIRNAANDAELSAVGRTLSVLMAKEKISELQFAKLVELGKQRRSQLARSSRQ